MVSNALVFKSAANPDSISSQELLKIGELLATRLCHELAGPVGAISNGVEFAQDVEEGASDAIELIAESAKRAASRLQFYRLAYGSAGQSRYDLQIYRQAALSFFTQGDIRLDWPEDLQEGFEQKVVSGQLILVALEILKGILKAGGSIDIAIKAVRKEGDACLMFSAQGSEVEMPQDYADMFERQNLIDPTVGIVHCCYFCLLAQKYHLVWTIETTGDRGVILIE